MLIERVVDKGSDSDVGFRKVILSGGEVVFKCVKCPCIFSSLHDVELHVSVCKKRKRVAFKYGLIGWCVVKPLKPKAVSNTVSNILLCCGCWYFREQSAKHEANGS